MIVARYNILHCDADPETAAWVESVLAEQMPKGYVLDHVRTLADATSALAEQRFDVVLAELDLPDSEGMDTFQSLRNLSPAMPLVLLCRNNSEQLALTAVRSGAQDYLAKDEADARALIRALRFAVERQQLQERLKNLTLEDELTGLYNQRGFYALAHEYAALAQRSGRGMLLLFIDLDGLKKINDSFGHAEGSRAIVAAGVVLEKTFRDTDLVARWGGDEFAVLLMETSEMTPELVMDRLESVLMRYNTQLRRGYDLAMSVGFARFDPNDPRPIEHLLREADEHMYEVKRARKAARTD
ncbi:MAG: GGDEF domain-containing response regulator [Candidatus Dadabacteria bacterium]|nr:MAG: GGDEF domain-containing response regulator [Candidatus Dadabacteria bacterium]